jgi:hypothetical protein
MDPWRSPQDRGSPTAAWHGVAKRRPIVVILLFGLGLLSLLEPAWAQKVKEYPLTVSIHEGVHPTLNQNDVEQILKRASDLLQQPSNGCSVGFKLKGPITTFTSAPAYINDLHALETVHKVPADVKVVQEINFCIQGHQTGLFGCSWRPKGRPTMIVTTQLMDYGVEHILWAHEFGHTTGLRHRVDEEEALMTPCGLDNFNNKINAVECKDFLRGSASHSPPAGPMCPDDSFAHGRTD